MQRIWLLRACLLALWGLPSGVPAATAQANPSGRPNAGTGDTLTISLTEAHRRALAQSPEFLAERQELAIARGQLTQARVYPFNPELELQAPGIGEAGTIGEYEVSLSQEIEWAGQGGLRVRGARKALARAEAVVLDVSRRTLAEVSNAYYEALSAQQRLAVAEELVQLGENLVAVTRIQAREGEISDMDANLAEIEAGRARAAILAAGRELTHARLVLRRLIGLEPEREIRLQDTPSDPPPAVTLDADSLIALALARRPDLTARTHEVEQQELESQLARREAIPSVQLGVFVAREERYLLSTGGPGGSSVRPALESPRLGLGVSVPLPLFQRNQGIIEEQTARTEQARLARQSADLAIRTEVIDAYQAYRAARAEHQVFERDVLQPARANQRLLDTALLAGKIGLPTLLLLRNQLLDAELSHWSSWLEERRALVALAAATATLSTDLTASDQEAP
jgi:outer membrane protein, heavy metal efflux system